MKAIVFGAAADETVPVEEVEEEEVVRNRASTSSLNLFTSASGTPDPESSF